MLKGEGNGPLSPLLQQYVELRERYPEYLLLFQVGDFYECFGEDAERLAKRLGLTLTHKTSKDFVTPMAGVPIRSVDGFVEKLLRQGIRVAIADQNAQDPVDGLMQREISQLMTPGTITDERLLLPDANYLAAIATGEGYGLAFLDITTGEFRGTHLYSKSSLYDELQRYRPTEVLLAPELYAQEAFRQSFSQNFALMLSQRSFELASCMHILQEHFGREPESINTDALRRAAGTVLAYALETQQGRLPQVSDFLRYDPGAFMQLDKVALSTLEVFESSQGKSEQSLFHMLDKTRTAPGRRLLKAWLRHPLLDKGLLEQRLDAVEAFVTDAVLRNDVRKALHKIHDLERLASRLSTGQIGARDLVALARSLDLIPELVTLLAARSENTLSTLAKRLHSLEESKAQITAALVEEPPLKITEGGLIKDGFDAELDALRHSSEQARTWIAELEQSERKRSGIASLKIGFNGVFGYYFEVTRPYYEQVPESFRAIQTLKDRQRYTRSDLRDKEREILRAEDAAKRREYIVFDGLRKHLQAVASEVRELGACLAELDSLASLAEAAVQQNYCRPIFHEQRILQVEAGRHPVVEHYHHFIANSLSMSEQERLLVLTGPNMSGKSTFLRQNALLCLMAQIGSFVPAEAARLPIFKRIYTRIGASDDIAGGRSTFMVEMDELARILRQADQQSLVLLDEIGRGTSTFDGLALAWSAIEYLHHCSGAFTLFATHYFELTQLASDLAAGRNYHVAAKEQADGLVFYHQVLEGPASKSYGLEVARLAGVPEDVLTRADQILRHLEAHRANATQEVIDTLLTADIDQLSPLRALQLVHQLQALARGLGKN